MRVAQPDENRPSDGEDADAAAGINLVTVIIMLAVLVVLVAGVFWVLPAWFGSSTITVNVRN